ncbi:MAG: VWA domain-containing protein, partial [Methanoregula sp.]|nr:VWA domain-containing protein [Methanoregula sp.]
NPALTADIVATVMDVMGNPVENETVTFALGTVNYPGGPYNVTSSPSLSGNSSKTNADGQAVVTFIPGSFSTVNRTSSTGVVTITATWNASPKNIIVTWKNYPYLSVKTSVLPPTVAVNDSVEISIAMVGDGWALQPTPVDVILCTDRSGSMLYDNPDRMYSIREAAKVFVNQMSPSRDYVGLVTFGRKGYISRPGVNSGIGLSEINNAYLYPTTYTEYATVDRTLSNGFAGVRTALDNIVPDHGTPMRSAVYNSVNEIRTRGRSNTLKAVILLSDGDYNWYGDPLARGSGNTNSETSFGDLTTSYYRFGGLTGSEQNMSVYARNNNIRIYSIAFGNSISPGGKTTLETLALATGGKYYTASATDIADVYKQIAGDLKDEAGVNTTMTADFQNLNVTGVMLPGEQVFSYVPHPVYSTRTGWQDGVINVTDQSADWAGDHKLDFAVGTIKVGQQWNTSFRLKANQSGSIDVFGANSLVSFNGGVSTLTLPHTFLTVVPHLNISSTDQKTITLENLLVTEPGEIKTHIPFTWNTSYTGNKTIKEQVYYSIDNGPWVRFEEFTHPYPYAPDVISATDYVDCMQLDVRKLPPGGYRIKVYATASDAPDDDIMTIPIKVGGHNKTYIKLE